MPIYEYGFTTGDPDRPGAIGPAVCPDWPGIGSHTAGRITERLHR